VNNRIALVLILGCALTLACGSSESPALRAGAAVVDITPKVWPLPMVGSFSYRPATSAHDPLHSRALVLDDGSLQLAIAVVDSCYIPRSVLDEAKERASKATKIPTNRMLVSATHTHTAPPPAPGVGLRGPEAQAHVENEALYSEQLIQGIVDSIINAHARIEPAEIGWAFTEVEDEVFNRRWFMKEGSIPPDPFGGTTDRVRMNPPRGSADLVRPAGPTDPEVGILSVRSAAGVPLALLANYSLHYVGAILPGGLSADYFGEFAREISIKLDAPADFVGILSNGTSGNINNIDFTQTRTIREPFEQVRKVAGKVADAVAQAYDAIEHKPSASLSMAERELTLALRKPSAEVYENSQELLTNVPLADYGRQHIYAQWAIALHDGPDSIDVKLQAIRIGDLGIAALPFETFVEIGLELKSKSAIRPMFTIELANGAEKYLPTPEHHELGGYETWLGTSQVETQASVKITKALLELLDEVAPDPAQ
jgi:neutral ceramidase